MYNSGHVVVARSRHRVYYERVIHLQPNNNVLQVSGGEHTRCVLVVRARYEMSSLHVVQALHRFHVTAAFRFRVSAQFLNAHRAGRTHRALASPRTKYTCYF